MIVTSDRDCAWAVGDQIADADLVARYEAMRPLARSAERDALLREIELRAARAGLIFDPASQIGYQWQDEDDSVIRIIRSTETFAAQKKELKRLRYLTQALGRRAVSD